MNFLMITYIQYIFHIKILIILRDERHIFIPEQSCYFFDAVLQSELALPAAQGVALRKLAQSKGFPINV